MSKTDQVWQWLKAFPKRHRVITGLSLIYIVWSLVTMPIRNPFPQEEFKIRGRFPFDQGYELMFKQNIYGEASWYRLWCGSGIFLLFGYQQSATCSEGGVWTKPKQIDGQHYEVTLYKDVYFKGLPNWTSNIWHTQYKANAGVDYTKLLVTDYGAPENSACDGSEEFLRKYEGKLFCTKQTRHKDFKHLLIQEGHPAGPNEKIQNFWLDSELEKMLPNRTPGPIANSAK